MASKSLGTLTLDLVAKVGGFVSGMDKAERASAKWSKQVQDDAQKTSIALAGIGAAAAATAAAVGVAGFNLLKSTSQQIASTDQWAKSLKISTQELLAWQFAAQRAGVEGDKMADIFKDLSDKIGDAVLNKSGEAVDALNALGLSAEKLSKVSPDKQMLAIGDALGKISTNAGRVTILESLGDDLSKLLPLFDNNNEKLQKFIRIAKDYGVAPDPASIDDLVKVNDIFLDMEAQVKGLKMEIAGGLAKADLSPLQTSLDEVRKVLTDPAVLQGIVDLVSQVAQLAGWLVKAASGAGKLAANSTNRMAALGGNIDINNPDQVQQRIDWLEKNQGNRSKDMYGSGQSFFGWITGKDDSIKAVNNELENLYKQREKLNKQKPIAIPDSVGSGTASSLMDFALPAGGTNGKVTPDASAKKLENAFKALELSYQRQIALIDTTGKKTAEVTEAQKLQFDIADGKLAGINAAQRTRLEGLAAEVDRLNDVKKANIEMAKVAEFTANLSAGNQNARQDLSVDVQGAGLGDKERDRMKERLSIERSFLDQQRQLQLSYQSGDITKSLYDQETSVLKSAMSDRLSIQDDYYKSVDAMQSDWVGGMSDGLANWLDESSNYSASAANIVSSTLSSSLDTVADALVGNKESWKDWSVSVLSMIAKVALQMTAVNLSSGIISSFGGAVAGAAAGGASANNSFSGGAYSGLTLNALGGVYDSPSLSAFSNGVYNSPTMFAFAKGAGVFAEAGPEAIMPLTRASDGSLGVRAVGGGGGGGTTISVNAPVSIVQESSAGDISATNAASTANQLKGIIQQTLTERLKKETSPGGLLSRRS
ncbi:phage tail tape measure protein [Winslowiella arboricola]|uniref:phage tail tape measure protein n=1 Tax=Winslowiella arboricola TaxID=2978220 RepID=UPI00225E46D2|nr:phage tail tape measure protein [Winslowiella arboricola]MCU5775234.1 phage tail tape measure protein [Winslowiella arboricola]